MYARVRRIAAEPGGQGPMDTIWLRCSQALLLSNTARAGAAGDGGAGLAACACESVGSDRVADASHPRTATDSTSAPITRFIVTSAEPLNRSDFPDPRTFGPL